MIGKVFIITKDLKYDGYQFGLASIDYKYLKLHVPSKRKLKKKHNVSASFTEYTWDANLTDMHLISKYNDRNPFLFIFIMFSWCF